MYNLCVAATCSYRTLPEIFLTREVEGEAAKRLQKCFAPGVIGLKQIKKGKEVAVVNSARYDTGSRNVFRHDDLKNAVITTRKQDHFIRKLFLQSGLYCVYFILLQLLLNQLEQ